MLNLTEIYIYAVQLFMYKYHHSLLPNIFVNFFTFNRDVHNHLTRRRDMLHTPLKISSPIIRIKGVTVDNYFSSKIDNQCTFTTYKKRVKTYMQFHDVMFLVE